MNKFMQFADELAKQNIMTDNGGPFGAVIVKNGVVVGVGNNQVVKSNDPTAHAEMTAIRSACATLETFNLEGCTLYTSCYPCPMCLSAIIWANIQTVYFGNTKEDAANIGFRDDMIYDYLNGLNDNDPDTTVLKLIPLDRDHTIKAFTDFQNKQKKTMY